MKKGKFLHPLIYKFAKLDKKEFKLNRNFNLNIRSSSYLKKFTNCVFNIHTGNNFIINDTTALRLTFKTYPFYNFKLGQFSYNKKIFIRNRKVKNLNIIFDDLKKKRGLSIKLKKKKRLIFKEL